jgi:hypothetical protein
MSDEPDQDSRRKFIAAAGATATLATPGTAKATDATQLPADVASILRVFGQYGRCLDDQRFEDLGLLFSKDAVLSIKAAGIIEKGREAIVAKYKTFTGGLHVIFNHIIDIHKNAGQASADFMFVDIKKIPHIAIVGRYAAGFVSDGATWRIGKWDIEVRATAPADEQN